MSDKQNETIADIVAEKRDRANEIERDVAEKMASGKMVSDQFAREVIAELRKEADRIEAAMKREREINQHPYADFGSVGVATVHHYEVREAVAGRCNLVATFTDPHRAVEFAQSIAGNGGADGK